MGEIFDRPLVCLGIAFAAGIALAEGVGAGAWWTAGTLGAVAVVAWLAGLGRRPFESAQGEEVPTLRNVEPHPLPPLRTLPGPVGTRQGLRGTRRGGGAALARGMLPGHVTLVGIVMLCLGAVAGMVAMRAVRTHGGVGVAALPDGGQTIVGTVANAPSYRDGVWRFVFAAEAHEDGGRTEGVSGNVFVRLKSSQPVQRGEQWRLTGRMRPVRTFANPGQRSEADRLDSLGVSSVLTVGSEELAGRLGSGRLSPLARHAFGAQRRALEALARYVSGPYREATATVAASVIFGVHATPPPAEIAGAFQRAGTIHLLVVSGAVVSAVFGMVFLPGALGASWRRVLIERQSGWPVNYRGRVRFYPGLWTAIIAIATVTYYAMLTEGGQAVTRAAVMGMLAALALALRRVPSVAREHGLNVDHYTLLAAAALAILVISPQALFQPGFQLSFAAVGAILYLTPKAMWLVGWLPRWLGYTIVGTVAAQLATFPILVWHFGQAPIGGFGANLLAIPLASVVLVSGMATCALAVIAPWAAPAAGWVAGISTRWLVWVSGAFASLPWASVEVARPNVIAVVAWYVGLVGVGRLLGKRQTTDEHR